MSSFQKAYVYYSRLFMMFAKCSFQEVLNVVECNRGVHFIFIDPFKFLTSLDFSISKLISYKYFFLLKKVSQEKKMVACLVMCICAIW